MMKSGVLLVGVLLLGCNPKPGAFNFDGAYESLVIKAGKSEAEPAFPAGTPRSAQLTLYIQGTNCALMNPMSGFQGHFKSAGGSVQITWYDAPNGKMKKPDVANFSVSVDGSTLTMVGNAEKNRLVFHRISRDAPPIKLPY
ncbi:MAG: hypothetical protein K8R88_00295 [Armatimonadetes bacterium]|nr:hypothetical protein [Armatimonadota bacterium]